MTLHDDLKRLWDVLPDDARDACGCEYSPERDVWWMECGSMVTDIPVRRATALICHAAEEWLHTQGFWVIISHTTIWYVQLLRHGCGENVQSIDSSATKPAALAAAVEAVAAEEKE